MKQFGSKGENTTIILRNKVKNDKQIFLLFSLIYNAGIFYSYFIIILLSMWKKIGAINNNNNDNKSSRSRDQNNQYQPFSQMSKIRMNQSQIGYQQSQYFCANYLNKKKSPQSKYLSQTRIKTEKQINNICVDPKDKLKQTNLRKKMKVESFQEMKKRISELQIFQDNQQNKADTPLFVANQNQFIQKNRSSTSIQFQQNTLRHYGSSPQLKSFHSALFLKQQANQNDYKNQQKNQTILKFNQLKQNQKQLKKDVSNQMKNFKIFFQQIKGSIKQKMIQQQKKQQKKKQQIKLQMNQKQLFCLQKNDFMNIIKGTTDFCNKLKMCDLKKQQLCKKYKLLKSK